MNKSLIKGCQTLKTLFGHETTGISCNDIAKQLNRTRSDVLKDLQALQKSGMAEQLPDKTWRVSASLAREAIKIFNHLDSARKRIDEAAQRYGI